MKYLTLILTAILCTASSPYDGTHYVACRQAAIYKYVAPYGYILKPNQDQTVYYDGCCSDKCTTTIVSGR